MKIGDKVGTHLICPKRPRGTWIVRRILKRLSDGTHFIEVCSACNHHRKNEIDQVSLFTMEERQ